MSFLFFLILNNSYKKILGWNPEEKYMLEKKGGDYKDYKQNR